MQNNDNKLNNGSIGRNYGQVISLFENVYQYYDFCHLLSIMLRNIFIEYFDEVLAVVAFSIRIIDL